MELVTPFPRGDTQGLAKVLGVDTQQAYLPYYGNPVVTEMSCQYAGFKYDTWARNDKDVTLPNAGAGPREALGGFQLWYAKHDLPNIQGLVLTLGQLNNNTAAQVGPLKFKASLFSLRGGEGYYGWNQTSQGGRWGAPGQPIGDCDYNGGRPINVGTYSPTPQTINQMLQQADAGRYWTTSGANTPTLASANIGTSHFDLFYYLDHHPTIRRGNYFGVLWYAECLYTKATGPDAATNPLTVVTADCIYRSWAYDSHAAQVTRSPYFTTPAASMLADINTAIPVGADNSRANGIGWSFGTELYNANPQSNVSSAGANALATNTQYTNSLGGIYSGAQGTGYLNGLCGARIMLVTERN